MSQSEHLKVNVCECGRIHLTYKSVTLHFEKEEFLHYAAHVGRMAMQVSRTTGFRQTMGLAGTKNINSH